MGSDRPSTLASRLRGRSELGDGVELIDRHRVELLLGEDVSLVGDDPLNENGLRFVVSLETRVEHLPHRWRSLSDVFGDGLLLRRSVAHG